MYAKPTPLTEDVEINVKKGVWMRMETRPPGEFFTLVLFRCGSTPLRAASDAMQLLLLTHTYTLLSKAEIAWTELTATKCESVEIYTFMLPL